MVTQLPGYNGKLLRINLSQQDITIEYLDEQFCRMYLGGAGFVAYYLFHELGCGIDALGPENKLVMATGPITGIPISGSGRHCIGAKSPLTGGFAKSESGGFWGAELKHAGFDVIIIEGCAKKPVYLWIEDGTASLKDASHLWGLNTKETQQAIRDDLGDRFIRVSSIGPAGENQVRFSCIINELHDAAGRGGLGAVMGSKKLKAIGVRGHQRLKAVDQEQLQELNKWLLANHQLYRHFRDFGTGSAMERGMQTGNLPVRNFRDGEFPSVGQITAEVIKDTLRIKMESCYACSVRCKKVVKLEKPYLIDPVYGGPEYETLAALGSNCGIDDLKAISKASELCNAYALDTISTGDVIAFAMECFENGLLTTDDTSGIELKFGNSEAMLAMVEMITRKMGIGQLLAEGVRRAAEKIGNNAAMYAMEVKGLEIPMHEPRVKAALGIGYMVNPHGADHCANLHDTMFNRIGPFLDRFKSLGILEPQPADDIGSTKVAMFQKLQLFRIASDCLVLCQFVPWNPKQVIDMLSAVTGWQTSTVELLKVAERVLNLGRLFNFREGFTGDDDRLPERFFQPKTDGVLSDKNLSIDDFMKAKQHYYRLMGWDPISGAPLADKLEELGIAWTLSEQG